MKYIIYLLLVSNLLGCATYNYGAKNDNEYVINKEIREYKGNYQFSSIIYFKEYISERPFIIKVEHLSKNSDDKFSTKIIIKDINSLKNKTIRLDNLSFSLHINDTLLPEVNENFSIRHQNKLEERSEIFSKPPVFKISNGDKYTIIEYEKEYKIDGLFPKKIIENIYIEFDIEGKKETIDIKLPIYYKMQRPVYSLLDRILFIDVTPTPSLHASSYYGDIRTVRKELKSYDIDVKDNRDRTALHWAIAGNQLEIVKLLVKEGADLEANSTHFSKIKHTPLFFAAREGNIEIFKYLIDSGASLENTPDVLNTAIECGHIDMVNLIIELGIDINYIDGFDDYTNTSILSAARSYNVSQYISGKPLKNKYYIDVIKILLKNGANPHFIDHDGNTALVYSCMLGNLESVKIFIKESVDINHKNNENKSALDYAKEKNKEDIVKYLLKNGAIE